MFSIFIYLLATVICLIGVVLFVHLLKRLLVRFKIADYLAVALFIFFSFVPDANTFIAAILLIVAADRGIKNVYQRYGNIFMKVVYRF